MPSESAVYWDACVFLAYLKSEPERINSINGFLLQAERDGTEILTSVITITEVAQGGSALDDDNALEQIDMLWRAPAPFKLVEFHAQLAVAARQLLRLARSTGQSLKPLDAIHLATAQHLEVSKVHTYDEKLWTWSDATQLEICAPDPYEPTLGEF